MPGHQIFSRALHAWRAALRAVAAERASGASHLTIHGAHDDSLALQVSGSGTITYRGDPAVTQDITGTGRLVKR